MAEEGKVLVTGATGFIGTRLVQALVERGRSVRALCRRDNVTSPPGLGLRDGAPLRHPKVELFRGDITDAESVNRAMEGCTEVFHVAGYAKNWAPDPTTFYRVNRDGVKNVLAAAQRCGVRRVVWTSTIQTFPPTPPGQIGDETWVNRGPFLTDYEASKVAAEKEALAMARQGLDVVIVNPTRVFGPGHITEGNSLSRLIDMYDRGRLPFLLNAGRNIGNYVFVEDVVEGHLLAMERGRSGEKYILGGENVSLREFFRLVDQVSDKRHFQIPIFRPGALTFAWVQKKLAEWFGIYPAITPGWVRTFLMDRAYTCRKAQEELGYQPRPLIEGLRITYAWLQRVREEQD